jgi:hypothetical protein
MFTLVKWFFIPVAVIACAVLFALLGFFEDGWFFVGFALISLLILIAWRCATFRLVRSYLKLLQQTADLQTQRQVFRLFLISNAVSLALCAAALLFLFVPATATSPSGRDLVLVTLFWTMIVKWGVLEILVHRTVAHASLNKDLSQAP